MAAPARWQHPGPAGRARALLAVPGELAWSACDVADHLRDSALVFAARIEAVRTADRPYLTDFSTCDPARTARYRAVPRGALMYELAAAQQRLAAAVAQAAAADLTRTARHEFDGDVTLAGILAFLPRHAGQLELLAQATAPSHAARSAMTAVAPHATSRSPSITRQAIAAVRRCPGTAPPTP